TYDQVERVRNPNVFYEIERNSMSIELPVIFMLRVDVDLDALPFVSFKPSSSFTRQNSQFRILHSIKWNVNFTHSNPFSHWYQIASQNNSDHKLPRIH